MKCKICKTCKKEYHYCTSCDYDKYNYAGYCSRECYENSEEWNIFSKKVKVFFDSLSKEQKLELWELWDNGILEDDKWDNYVDKIIIDPRNNE